MLAQVHQIEDVFLEAGTAETDRGFEELWSDSGIGTDRFGYLIDIGSGRFAQRGDRIDGGNSLGQECVGR